VVSPWQPVAVSEPEKPKVETTTVTSLAGKERGTGSGGGAYKPPALRKNQKDGKAPPDINSSQAFPSLKVATKGNEDTKVSSPVMKDYTELILQNKFSTLTMSD
jgi:hypothetical protein